LREEAISSWYRPKVASVVTLAEMAVKTIERYARRRAQHPA
jgi:hypothetical protein